MSIVFLLENSIRQMYNYILYKGIIEEISHLKTFLIQGAAHMKDETKEKLATTIDLTVNASGDVLAILSDFCLTGVAATLVGSVAPGAISTMLAYKQKRAERNLTKMIEDVVAKQEVINERLVMVEDKILQKKMKTTYFELLLDTTTETRQEDKIPHLVDGYINLLTMVSPQEDVIRNYYYTMSNLTLLDIQFLKFHIRRLKIDPFKEPYTEIEIIEDIFKYFVDNNVDVVNYSIIGHKLETEGLLISSAYMDLHSTVHDIIKYLKGNDEIPNNQYQLDNYSFSEYGKQFMNFFFINDTNKM